MKGVMGALLLAIPWLAWAECFVHPDNGVTYCTSAEQCPQGSRWNERTQACSPQPPAAPRACYIEIVYPQGLPTKPGVQISEWCDQVEAEAALSVALTKLIIGLPPYP